MVEENGKEEKEAQEKLAMKMVRNDLLNEEAEYTLRIKAIVESINREASRHSERLDQIMEIIDSVINNPGVAGDI